MKGFVIGCGHSGTKWAAVALREAARLDARHESWRRTIGSDYGGVESNGNLWNRLDELVDRFPDARILQLVRDGRLVVRTIMTKQTRPPDFFEAACRRWAGRNDRLSIEICNADRYRLEDLVSDFRAFRAFAEKLGAVAVDRSAWDRVRKRRVNASAASDRRRFAAYEDWSAADLETFERVCGPTMRAMGYSDERLCCRTFEKRNALARDRSPLRYGPRRSSRSDGLRDRRELRR